MRPVFIIIAAIGLMSGCKPTERAEIKIPPLPKNEAAVVRTSLAALTDALDDEPGNSEYHFRRALLHEQARDFSKALRDVNQAIENRRTGQAYGRYYVLRGRIYLNRNQTDLAFADALQSEKLGVQSAEADLLRGQMYCIKQQYAKANAALRSAARRTPFDSQIYYWQANVAAGRGDTTQAIALLNGTLGRRRDYVQAYNRLTELYAGLKDYPAAKQYAFAGLKIDSNNVPVNTNLGRIYQRAGQSDSAVQCYRRALKRDTSLHRLNYEIGVVYLQEKNYGAATRYFEKLIPHLNRFSDVPDILAVCYGHTGQDRSKLDTWKADLETDSTNTTTQRLYAALARRVQAKRRQATMDSLANRQRRLFSIKPNIKPVEIKRR